MVTADSHRIVAHIDILGMSALIKKDPSSAWKKLSALTRARNDAMNLACEFVDTNEIFIVPEGIMTVMFSDTLLAFTKGTSRLLMFSMRH